MTLLPRIVGQFSEQQPAALLHGTLTPARISRSRPPCVCLGLDGSIIVPERNCCETACHRLFSGQMDPLCTLSWPSLIGLAQDDQSNLKMKWFLRFDSTQPLQVVSAHLPVSLVPGKRTPSGKYSENRILDFQGPRGRDQFTPSLLSRVREGVENQKFIILLSSSP